MSASRSDKFYDRFSFLYPVIDIFLTAQKRKLFQSINDLPSGRLLEIGVGNGRHFKYYNTHEVVGIDTSTSMLSRARDNLKGNIKLLQMNGENLLFPQEDFDYVVLSHVITVINDPEKLFEEVHRVLKPNGKVFVLNHFTPDNWLMYLDRMFERFSSIFYFKSIFDISRIGAIRKFRLLTDADAGFFSYFRILVYEKKV